MVHPSERFNFQNDSNIPKERGRRSCAAAGIGMLFCLLYLVIEGSRSSDHEQQGSQNGTGAIQETNTSLDKLYFEQIAISLLIQFTTETISAFMKGLCDFTEEITHLKTRYRGNLVEAFKACFNERRQWPFRLMIALATLFRACELREKLNLPLVCISQLLLYTLGHKNPTKVDISKICEMHKLNVAHGLAWSYYLGYLKIILPRLKEAVRLFNEENGNLLRSEESCKLYILIPLSCRIYDHLSAADSNIQCFKDLTPIHSDRAGIRARVYKNSIHRIFDEEQRPYYCIVEYATPLLTLQEMSNIASAAFSREDRSIQAKLFYRTLRDILEGNLEPGCRNMYRLIPYEDLQDSDEESSSHYLSNLILNHMKQQQQEEYFLYESSHEN
ncbi:stimulator of interferon genes protein isoform X2 [Ambystoma mexicanum]